ncbi:MAG: metabolite traffic protein EboE, partial [Bacteroidetes bacterium]|nr:metabolite traffic protein EboE [Bacteroidota bacterium]
MHTPFGHLSYCTNIHSGENWQEHFTEIKKSVPFIKNKISPNLPFGIGLRLSNAACVDLSQGLHLQEFKNWLQKNNCYVFTINGFPFGDFHQSPLKDQVYSPDWTMPERVQYTLKLFNILKEILPEGMEGSVSTAPLSYRHWFKNKKETIGAYEKCTLNILEVVGHLIEIQQDTGKVLHLNIEPEPDGLIENTTEFIDWYNKYYIPLGINFLEKRIGRTGDKTELLKRHLQLCFDVCHSALAYEKTDVVLEELKKNNILIGKVQISSALQINLVANRDQKIKNLGTYNEPLYLHQVVAKDLQNKLHKFRDLSDALIQLADEKFHECRVHFHVPVFSENYDILSSTQDNILQTLLNHNKQ